ncbi:MAG: DUF362 domain-containing protein [Candidatus Cloacimonetes bacterium]|nr:DUF362 domain-containing protein [Candidatus Cloacimonadota bacterium]
MKPIVYAHSAADFASSVDKLLNDIGFDAMFSAGDTVVLKPNFVAPRDNSAGATTSLALIERLARRLRSLGAIPVLTEVSGMEFDTRQVFGFLGVDEMAKACGLEILIPTEADYVRVFLTRGKALKQARINRLAFEAKLINLPVLKTHVITGVTTGMKNLMGLVDNRTRKQMHIRGIHQCIADLATVIQPTLTICDATRSMEGDGAVYGTARKTDMLFASTDQRALDRVLCDFMGVDWRSIGYIRRSLPPADIDLRGGFTPQRFVMPRQGAIYRLFYRAMYLVDMVWEPLFHIHFNEFLYKTGRFGTHPFILADSECAACRRCIEVCPTDAIHGDWSIDPKRCLRCLRCYDACPRGLIHVKGFSNPERYTNET